MKFLIIVLALIAACGRDEPPPLPPPPPIPVHVTIGGARSRIFEAEQRLAARYRLDGAAGLVERIAFLRGVDQAKPPPHETEPDAAARTWTSQHRLERIAQLEQRLQEYLRRGSTDAYRAAATIDVELDELRRMAIEAGLTRDVVPEDALRLLEQDKLVRLDHAWEEASRALEITQVQIGLPSEAGLAASEVIEKQRARIRAALSAPSSDVARRFAAAPKRAVVEDVAWVTYVERNRDHLIQVRERQLLQQALARDGSDIPVVLRLAELDKTDPTVVAARLRAAVIDSARTFHPTEVVSKKFYDRLHDPVRAAWRDAALQLTFEHDRKWMPTELRKSRSRWELSLLDDGDLAERFAWSSHTMDALERMDAQASAPFVRELDRDQVRSDFEAMKAEIARRQAGTRLAPWKSDAAFTELLLDDVPTDVTVLAYPVQRSFWQSLELLSARGYETPAVRALAIDLSLEGYRLEAKWLARYYTMSEKLKERSRSSGLSSRLNLISDSTKLEGADHLMSAQATRILAGLDDLVASGVSTERVKEIRAELPLSLLNQATTTRSRPDLAPRPGDSPRPFGDEMLQSTRNEIDTTITPILDRVAREFRTKEAAEEMIRLERLREEYREPEGYEREMKDLEREGIFKHIFKHVRK